MSSRDVEWRVVATGERWRLVSINEKAYREWFNGKDRWYEEVELPTAAARDRSIPRHVPEDPLAQRQSSPSKLNRHERSPERKAGEQQYEITGRGSSSTRVIVSDSRRNRVNSSLGQAAQSSGFYGNSSSQGRPLSFDRDTSSGATNRHAEPLEEKEKHQSFYSQPLPFRSPSYDSSANLQSGATFNRHNQNQPGPVPNIPGTRLSEPLLSFSHIEPGDFESCQAYVEKNPKVLDESRNPLLSEAIQAQKDGRDEYVRACIQRAIIIKECKDFSMGNFREYMSDLINEEGDVAQDFYDSFDLAYKNVMERAGVRRRGTDPLPAPTLAIGSRTVETLPSISESQIEFKGTKGDEEKLDRRYKIRGDPKEFFVVGRLFALLWHENAGKNKQSAHGNPDFTSKGRYGENIFSHIRRMVVVRKHYGYCWCLPINSYGGHGVSNKKMSKEEAEAHTIIHMIGAPALRLKSEDAMKKEPIAVNMATGQTLNQMSRLNFAKIHTVEHNVKVMDVGMVCRVNMHRLEGYWRTQMLGPST